MSICYCASYHIPHLNIENKVPLGFLWHFLHMHCVDFVENALFRSYGNICQSSLPSLLLDRLTMDQTDSCGFFSRRLVCRSSDRSYNSTDSSLNILNCQLSFLISSHVLILLTQHTMVCCNYVRVCNAHSCGHAVVTSLCITLATPAALFLG